MANLRIEIHSYWHAGSGRGAGPGADAVVVRTPAGLPYLPGRTLKGLLRDACLEAEGAKRLPEGRTVALFGGRADPDAGGPDKGKGRFSVEPGALRISDARLGASLDEQQAWEAWAGQKEQDGKPLAAIQGKLSGLTDHLSSTAMKDGIASEGALRTVEVIVPLTLHAFVEPVDGQDPGDWAGDLQTALPLLRAIGSKRSRGFGRCTASLTGEGGR